jgi:hypothetical protein
MTIAQRVGRGKSAPIKKVVPDFPRDSQRPDRRAALSSRQTRSAAGRDRGRARVARPRRKESAMRPTSTTLPLPSRERAGVRGTRVESGCTHPPSRQKLTCGTSRAHSTRPPLSLTEGREDQTRNATWCNPTQPSATPRNRTTRSAKRTHHRPSPVLSPVAAVDTGLRQLTQVDAGLPNGAIWKNEPTATRRMVPPCPACYHLLPHVTPYNAALGPTRLPAKRTQTPRPSCDLPGSSLSFSPRGLPPSGASGFSSINVSRGMTCP